MSKGDGFQSGMGVAFRLGTEMLVATALGSLMGYTADYFLNTSPWFMIIGLFFGAAAGCLNAYRAALELEEANKSQEVTEEE